MADISNITTPNGTTYNIKDATARSGYGNAKTFYGTCDTDAATVAKVVTCSAFTASDLTAGTIITVKFTNTNSGAVASLTLNVNSTGAKNIKYIYNGALSNIPSAAYLASGQAYQFYYDGTYWVVLMMYNTNTTYSSKTAASGGTDVSLVTTGEKYTWNNKQNALTNPVTGTGTSGYLAKWNGTGTVTSGPQLGSSTTTYLRNNGTWGAPAVPTKMSDLEQDVDYVMGTGSTGYLAEWDGEGTITSGPQFGSSTTTFLRNDGSWATPASGSGTVTKVTAGTGLTGGDITTTGTINHSNSVTAQTTQAVYPIKIDAQGHISAYGTAVTSMTPSSHTHGNITNAGDITASATIASGDRLVINDESASKITNSSITFGTSTTTYLRNDGTWGTPSGGGDLGFTIKYGVSTQFSADPSSTGTCKATYTGFTDTPTVVGTLRGVSSTTNQLVLMITARSATQTTFTIRNNGTAKRTGYVDWIAIGT